MAIDPSSDAKDVPASATGDDPLDSKNTVDYWFKWLKAARTNKYAERHRKDSLEAWKQYEKDYETRSNQQDTSDKLCVYPIYWSSSQYLESAFYARTPQIITTREFEINDDIANTMSLISERIGKYQVRNSNFDSVMQSSVGDFIHAAKATNQVVYEAKITAQKKRNPLLPVQQPVQPGAIPLPPMQQGDGQLDGQLQDGSPAEEQAPQQFTTPEGQEHTGEVLQDEQGYFFETDEEIADPATQKIYLAPVCFDEILHTPNAKTFNDITEIAYYFTFTKDEAEDKFTPEVLRNYPWKDGTQKPDKSVDDLGDDRANSPDKFMDGWEIYCKTTGKVYWVSESYRQDFLKPAATDPYKLKNFFPSPPFIVQNKPRKNLYPRPTYVQLKPTLDQLNLMYERVFGLIDSIRRRAIVDGDEDVVNALNAGDQEFVSAKSLKNIVEKGGLDKMIWYIPVQELVQAISELGALEDRFKANASEWFGIPDILRGMSDPIEAMGTQQIKASAAQDRFKLAKKSVQQLARDSIEMMVDLALQVYSDEKIQRICGFQFMDPADQQRFPQALAALRDDEERIIRIDIETDSLTFVDDDLIAQRRNQAIQNTMSGIQGLAPLMQQNPTMGTIALKALLLQLENTNEGKEFQDQIKQLGKELTEAAQTPPPPAQPDPMIAIKQGELALKQQQAAADSQFRVQELELKQQMETNNYAIKEATVQIQGLAVQSKAQADQTKHDLDAVKEHFKQFTDIQALNLEKSAVMFEHQDKLIQNARLERDQALEGVKLLHDHIHRTNDALIESAKASKEIVPKIRPRKRIGKISVDATGNPQVEIHDVTDGEG